MDYSKKLEAWAEKRATAIWENLQKNNLWQRMMKNTIATTIAVIIALLPPVVRIFGRATYLAPMVTVFGHPGRRFGMMAEGLVLIVLGTLAGLGWSLFGVYLSSVSYPGDSPEANTIRGIFLAIAVFFHGYFRSHTPRLFMFLLLLVIVAVVTLISPTGHVTKAAATQILYPVLSAAAILILVNVLVFPEFSGEFLGDTTIETLGETVDTLRDAGRYFINIGDESGKKKMTPVAPSDSEHSPSVLEPKVSQTKEALTLLERCTRLFHKTTAKPKVKNKSPKTVTLKSLTDKKTKLRSKLAGCKAAQQECNFELAFSVLPPEAMKPISVHAMNKLVQNAIALIGACESKYALMGDENDKATPDKPAPETPVPVVEDEERVRESARTRHGMESPSGRASRASSAGYSSDDKHERRHSRGHSKTRTPRKRSRSKLRRERKLEDLELVKPKKEIEFGDIELLRYLVHRIAKPLEDLQEKIDRSVDVVTSCLAYCYDVPRLPSGARAPHGIHLQEIDIRVDILVEALGDFDKNTASALEGAASIRDQEHPDVDVMPRMETFLISLFLLNLRQAALHTLAMLNHSRIIVEKRQARHERRRLYAPKINWRKWLLSGGEEDMLALPDNARKDARTGNKKADEPEHVESSASNENLLEKYKTDIEAVPARGRGSRNPSLSRHRSVSRNPSIAPSITNAPRRRSWSRRPPKKKSLMFRLRNGLADVIEGAISSDDAIYALKLTIAVFLVTFPAFVKQWSAWYTLSRGVWAALQLVLISEVAIGTSVVTFSVRAVGTTIGCIWGYVAYEAHNGNRIVSVVVLVIGIIPSTYVQLGSKYVKAGMVSIVSMSVVCLATLDATVPGTATENFLKRLIAFLIGGAVALGLQAVFLPVKARDRLVESLASSIGQIIEMEACLAYGIDAEENIDIRSNIVSERFDHAKSKAQGALTAAQTFLPFCASEPRLKGSFEGLALVYAEILYVLHGIVERMDNMMHLRREYGSGVLEELNTQVFAYRRNVAGAITITLFAAHEALTTKLPLPQFLPSARLSHLRMVNRVREVVMERGMTAIQEHDEVSRSRSDIEVSMVKQVIRQKFLSWNAASAGQIEVIEFLEELIDLTKLLVGANEFRSGMLTRPTHRDGDRIERGAEPVQERETQTNINMAIDGDETSEARDVMTEKQDTEKLSQIRRRRRSTFSRNKEVVGNLQNEKSDQQKSAEEEELPRSLQRVRTRRIEEMNLQKSRSGDGKGKAAR
ncbi:hypothetical protein HYFRA_00011727 [Hymenoscyphus fraxineus]|uniref:ER transporter 6TM N-terminal domain-containing protein n=1 Tax=Hymenoscyphus fraxineus TaxID=746836 RepID=A0A9N9PYK3_9HELO|nr:hypothetical protein HYFRA_00011727 [Hymenoscyphus fraxineus]